MPSRRQQELFPNEHGTVHLDGQNRPVSDQGVVYDFAEAVAKIPWVNATMYPPPHQYVTLGMCPRPEWDVVAAVINEHPDAYLAYFRGYLRPNRYYDFNRYRYWRTSAANPRGVTHMLNRGRFEDAEPPRRLDQGGEPMDWVGNPSLPYGSKWPEWQVLGPDGWYRDRSTGGIAGRDNELTFYRNGGKKPKR